eukprot:7148199-Prymnesium_polylepis.1
MPPATRAVVKGGWGRRSGAKGVRDPPRLAGGAHSYLRRVHRPPADRQHLLAADHGARRAHRPL